MPKQAKSKRQAGFFLSLVAAMMPGSLEAILPIKSHSKRTKKNPAEIKEAAELKRKRKADRMRKIDRVKKV